MKEYKYVNVNNNEREEITNLYSCFDFDLLEVVDCSIDTNKDINSGKIETEFLKSDKGSSHSTLVFVKEGLEENKKYARYKEIIDFRDKDLNEVKEFKYKKKGHMPWFVFCLIISLLYEAVIYLINSGMAAKLLGENIITKVPFLASALPTTYYYYAIPVLVIGLIILFTMGGKNNRPLNESERKEVIDKYYIRIQELKQKEKEENNTVNDTINDIANKVTDVANKVTDVVEKAKKKAKEAVTKVKESLENINKEENE